MKQEPSKIMTPQWVTIKEELIADYHELWNHFSNWNSNRGSMILRRYWVTTLFALLGKIRGKLNQDSEFKEDVLIFDSLFDRDPLSRDPETQTKLIRLTRMTNRWMEKSGLYKVEQELMDPLDSYEMSYPN